MSVSASIPATVQIRRSHLLGLVVLVAALSATVTWAALALDTRGTAEAAAVEHARPAGTQATPAELVTTAAQDARRFRSSMSIMSLTPAQLAANALGTGYALPTQSVGTVGSVLASMSPQTRRYTVAVMGLTFAQLAAGGAGHP